MNNSELKVIHVVGARPNFMKTAPIIAEMNKFKEINQMLVHTGQHYDKNMSEVFFENLNMPNPDIFLGVGSGSHAEQTAKIMIEFERILLKERPDLVMVVGDVNSTIACALTTVKLDIKVAHVEAGLRSFDRTMPEEINRILTDAISDYLFITEESARNNLLNEGIPQNKIFFVGNVMIDTLMKFKKKADRSKILYDLALKPKEYVLLTLHRPSNVDVKHTFESILEALDEISRQIMIIYAAHPRTKQRIEDFNLHKKFTFLDSKRQEEGCTGFRIIDPLGYTDFVKMMSDSRFVLTDSGGIQEETTILGVPCLTLRNNTERPVTVKEGTNVLVGTSPKNIREHGLRILKAGVAKGTRKRPKFWDGRASERIVKVIYEEFIRGK